MAFGLRPVRMLGGAAWSGNTVPCVIGSDIATAQYIGDPVINTTAGAATIGVTANYLLTDAQNTMETGGTYPVVTIASAGSTNRVYGAIVGFEPNRGDLSKVYREASTVRIARVALADPMLVFEVTEDADTTPLTIADVGRTVSLIATAAGSTTTGYSGWTIDSTSNTTTTLQCMIVGFKNTAENYNNIGTNKAIWEVTIMQPSMFPMQFGLGV